MNTYTYTYYPANATSNTATITSGTIGVNALDENYAAGGMVLADGNAQSNTLNLSGGTIGTVSGNTNYVSGGYTVLGNATGNTLNISGGTIGTASGSNSYIAGGYTASGTASGNTVNISGGTFGAAVSVADTDTSEETDTTTAQTMSLLTVTDDATTTDLSTLSNYIAGGYSADGDALDNTVNLTGSALTTGFSLYGGVGQMSTGNTLNVYTKGNSVGNLAYFQNLNFYVPADAANGDTLLTVNGTADVTGAAIKAGVADTTQLKSGDIINLLYDASGITTDNTTYGTLAGLNTITDAAFVTRPIAVKQQDAKTIVMEILGDDQATLSKDTKLFAEARATAVNILANAADFAATDGFASAAAAYHADHGLSGAFTPYVALGGYNLRADTGSYVDTNGLNANLGFVHQDYAQGHTDTIMPFIEYGNGNYTSHLDDGARADGDQHYVGAGLLLRRDQTDGLYYETMLHAGRLNGDFKGLIEGYQASYDSSSTYVGAMLGLGKLVPAGKNATYDYYGKVFWNHLASDTAQVHSALGTANYHFDTIDSYRTRLGLRWTRHLNQAQSFYAGLAWDYEWKGDAHAQYRTFDTPSPSTKGSSAMLELGWQSKMDKNHDWGADLHVTGWAGTQRGVTYSATVSRAF